MTPDRPPGRRAALQTDLRWLSVAALLFVAAATMGAVVADRLPPLDVEVLAEFRGLRESALWPLFAAVNLIGYPAIWDVAVVLVVAAVVAAGRAPTWIAVPAAMFAAEIVTVGFKLAVDRLRPPGVVISDLVTVASYPSGHVARVAATLGAVVVLAWPALRRRGPLPSSAAAAAAFAAVLVMAVARLGAGEHWPTDVLGAILVAGAIVAILAALRVPRPTAR